MPKAPSSSSNRPALRRNQACRACRKRKLKCDAARPHCGTCVKQWQSLISVPAPVGYAHPTEPQCIYDPVDGLPLAPDIDPMEKIRLLEEEISQLKSKIYEQSQASSTTSTSPGHQSSNRSNHSHLRPGSSSSSATGSHSSDPVSNTSLSLTLNGPLSVSSPETRFRSGSGSPQLLSRGNKRNTDGLYDILFSGWNPDLPKPQTLCHYVELFFKCDPCGSRILHRSTFIASLRLAPKDPAFPHSAILHAICASASRWAPRNVGTLPDGSRIDHFADYHASKTRQYIDKTLASGEDIFPVVQACILLAWYFYQEGRWVEVWVFAGFQTRVAIPLRLNYPGTFSTQRNNSPGAFLPPPKDFRDLESRRRTWWMTIIFDRIAAVGGWVHAIDERDIGTELPLRSQDFEAEQPIPSNPQDMYTEDLFTSHLPRYTDSFLLLIKAVMMFGRVTDYNVRGSLRAPVAPRKTQNPFMDPGFLELDELVHVGFFNNLPQAYRSAYGTGVTDAPNGETFDTDLYIVHIIPHAAAITLHNSYLDFENPQSISTERCFNAARSILTAYYMLSATSLDITLLHPFVTICWYLAAVVQVQLCRFYIEVGDRERENEVWGEINVLRAAMLNYGKRSPIGTRQEKLLQGLMREIVVMTSQTQPLEVGLPLYPFSHAGVFPTPAAQQLDGPLAPLPQTASISNDGDSVTSLPAGLPRAMIDASDPLSAVWRQNDCDQQSGGMHPDDESSVVESWAQHLS